MSARLQAGVSSPVLLTIKAGDLGSVDHGGGLRVAVGQCRVESREWQANADAATAGRRCGRVVDRRPLATIAAQAAQQW